MQANHSVIRMGNHPTVRAFLGIEERIEKGKQKPGTVSLFKRNKNRKALQEPESEDVLLQALLILNMQDHCLSQYHLMRGTAVRAADGVLVHAGEWISYLNADKQECIGNLKEGLLIVPKRGYQMQVVVVHLTAALEQKVMGCLKIKRISQTTVVPSTSVLKKVNVLHDCNASKCRIIENSVQQRIEQQNVLQQSIHLKHNYDVNQYIVNKFSLA